VQEYTWHFEVVWENLAPLLAGLRMTVMLSVLAFALGLVLGLVAAFGRISRFRPINALSTAYVEFFRNTPLLAQLWWMYYVIPFTTGITVPRFETGVIAFGLNIGAFLSEIYRAGIMSISSDQRNAALALGMTSAQAMRRVVLPQAVSRVVPPMGSMWVGLFKDTAIVSVIAVPDLMHAARVIAVETYRPLEILTVTALIYFIVTYPQARGVDFLHRKFRVVE
jgi:His/Glu/Gln/Arg/opine family amino acid ABC transporter permease subunit